MKQRILLRAVVAVVIVAALTWAEEYLRLRLGIGLFSPATAVVQGLTAFINGQQVFIGQLAVLRVPSVLLIGSYTLVAYALLGFIPYWLTCNLQPNKATIWLIFTIFDFCGLVLQGASHIVL